ncbi:DUF6807 family protein [Halosimplex salinum]|uniref:DUF6807 family protein n=1 Tax=Halosimplex salinum TaxID=1710538 RepID=UPI000F490FE9|nr:DUF6807 family protein [Halosimplex salinum]
MVSLSVTDDDGTVSVFADDILLTRYNADPAGSKPGFDTVALPPGVDSKPGENLVVSSPHDHPWHFGLFFCQKLVDGINCWESEPNAAAGKPHGFADAGAYDVRSTGSGVEITQEATWQTDSGEELLGDDRTIRIAEPDDEGYLLTWEQAVTALGQRRHLSSETLHGHYSGLSTRFARSLRGGRVLLPDGTDPGETSPPRAASGPAGRWCDYSGALDGRPGAAAVGEPWSAGIAMFDHPENGSDPVNWFIMDEPFGFLAANPTWGTVETLAEGESLSWTWGLWVHSGTPDEERVEDAYESFVDSV